MSVEIQGPIRRIARRWRRRKEIIDKLLRRENKAETAAIY